MNQEFKQNDDDVVFSLELQGDELVRRNVELTPQAKKRLWVEKIKQEVGYSLRKFSDSEIEAVYGMPMDMADVEYIFGKDPSRVGGNSPAALQNKLRLNNEVAYVIMRQRAEELGLMVPRKQTLAEKRTELYGHL